MNRIRLAAWVTLAGVAAAPSDLAGQVRRPPVPWLAPCTIASGTGAIGAWCGRYEVYENRELGRGRKIPLKVLVVPARAATAEPDPVVFLHGGPGGAATEAAPRITGLLARVRESRDLLFVDQRGTGGSNPLDCDPPAADAPLQEHFKEFLDLDGVRRCLARQDADVRLYTSGPAMDDLDEVRRALGYERLNLFGGSYGTRAALVFLRRHANRVRTAVLKGVAPTDMKNPLPFARALERGLRGIFQACAVDTACHETFPDLERQWERVTRRFAAGPVTARLKHPQTGAMETVTIPKGVFADGIRHILYDVRHAATLPGLIHAAALGDFSVFAEEELEQSMRFGGALSMGVFLTVTCSEDLRFLTEEEIARETGGTFLGDYRVRRQLAACAVWGRADVGEDFIQPVRADVPVLLLSGFYDTATPYEGGNSAARYLPNSLHLIFPNQSHDSANPECEIGLITAFIQTGSVQELDTACVAETNRPPFGVSRGRTR